MDEFKKMLPTLKVLRYIGSKDEREACRKDIVEHVMSLPKAQRKDPPLPFQVMVTTYELLMKDIEFFHQFRFKYVIVDEGLGQ